MSDELFGFLGEEVEDSLPEGGGVFENTGFIGPLMAQRFWQFYSAEDLVLYESDYTEGEDYFRRPTTNGYFYYFNERDPAFDAAKLLEEYNPRRIWRFEMETARVKNFASEKALDAFDQTISQDARIASLASAKYRHEYHLLALPSLVNALAVYAGFIDEPIWHANELLSGEISDEQFTERLQYKLIGDPGATEQDQEYMAEILQACGGDLNLAHDVALSIAESPPADVGHLVGETRIHYKFSTFWTRRAALWQALGEPNAEAYIPEGKAQTEWGKDYTTDADQLVKCLGVVTRKWKRPIWARFHLAKDPRFDATWNDRRLNLPLISEMFADESTAEQAAKEELQSRGQESSASTSSAVAPAVAASDEPAVPEAWQGAEAEWKQYLGQEKEKLDGELPSMPNLVKMGQNLSAEPAEIKAWWPLV